MTRFHRAGGRFSVNGYAPALFFAFEYDTTIPTNDHAVTARSGR